MNNIEVDEQSNRLSTQLEIGEQLDFVDFQHLLDYFQFHDYTILHKKIYLVAALDLDSVVKHREPHLDTTLSPRLDSSCFKYFS